MFERLPSLKSMHAFEAAARLGSFTEAAGELGLTPGAIGYQVKQLEAQLGVDLFLRQVRKIVLTEEGKALYRTAHKAFRDLDNEVRHISPRQYSGTIDVAASTYFVARWLSERLARFLDQNTGVDLRLHHTVNNPDFALKNVDLAIRWGKGNWSDCEVIPLIQVPLIAVCAPGLLESSGHGVQKLDIYKQSLLCDQPGNDYWIEWFRASGFDPDRKMKRRVVVDANVRLQSTIDGLGISLSHAPMIQSELDTGRLVAPFDMQLSGYGFYLLIHSSRTDNPEVSHFCEWMSEEAKRFSELHMFS